MIDEVVGFILAHWLTIFLTSLGFWVVSIIVVEERKQRAYDAWLASLSEEEREEYFAHLAERRRKRAAAARKERLDFERREQEWHDYMIYSGEYDQDD